jgi:valyl-tRNA synthetase
LVTEAITGVNSFIAGTDEFYITLNIAVDAVAEGARLGKRKGIFWVS